METIEVYCDGACFPNPGRGGWGWTTLKGRERSGCEERSTNQRMELMAVIDAIEQCHEKGKELLIITDSQYVIKGATQWIHGWMRNGWKNSKGFPVKNKELWELLHKRCIGKSVRFEWVKGHSGDPGNERADELATEASGAEEETINKCREAWHS